MIPQHHSGIRRYWLLSLQGQQLEKVLGPLQQKFVSVVAKDLHKEQPWFHGSIEREAADMAMLESGHQDGKFLYVVVVVSVNQISLSCLLQAFLNH